MRRAHFFDAQFIIKKALEDQKQSMSREDGTYLRLHF